MRLAEMDGLDAELLSAIIVEMVRSGVVPADVLERVKVEFEAQERGHTGNSRADRYRMLASMAFELQLKALAQTPSDFHAERKRRQMHVIPIRPLET